ncbi:MAG: hypothetical protein WAW59_07065 [Patescibacteria group bacterium]
MQHWPEVCLYLSFEYVICIIKCILVFNFLKLGLYEVMELSISEVESASLTYIPYIKKISNRGYLSRECCSYLLCECFSDIDTRDIMLCEYSFFEYLVPVE